MSRECIVHQFVPKLIAQTYMLPKTASRTYAPFSVALRRLS